MMPETSKTIQPSSEFAWQDGGLTTATAWRMRAKHLSAEYALKRSALLLLALSLVVALVAFVAPWPVTAEHGSWHVILFRVQATLVCVVSCFTVWGVRRMAAWSRLPLRALALLCLPLFPPGTFLSLKIFLLLAADPEPRLLTKEYEQIVHAAGPMSIQMSRRIHPLVWVVLAFVILIVVLTSLISLIPEEIRHNL